jgi:hypothetical protein
MILKSASKGLPGISFRAVIFFTLLVGGCTKGIFDMTPPSLVSCFPEHGQSSVALDASICLKFSEEMDRKSVEDGFSIISSGLSAGRFEWQASDTARFVFDNKITSGKAYTYSLGPAAKDKAGNEMGREKLVTFYAGTVKPVWSVVRTVPQDMSEHVNCSTDISVFFSEPMDRTSVQNAFSISPVVNGVYSWTNNDTLLRYMTARPLSSPVRYTVTLPAGIFDKTGMASDSQTLFSFLTGRSYGGPSVSGIYTYGDTGMPIESRYWPDGKTGISKNTVIALRFTKTMNHFTAENAFSLEPAVQGWFEWSTAEGETMIFHPDQGLEQSRKYVASVDQSASDSDNNALASEFRLEFTINAPDSQSFDINSILPHTGGSLSRSDLNTIPLSGTHTNTFLVGFGTVSGIDIGSVQDNTSISRFAGSGDPSYAGAVFSVSAGPDPASVLLKLGDLAPKNYYKLNFNSGDQGIRDNAGNLLIGTVTLILIME